MRYASLCVGIIFCVNFTHIAVSAPLKNPIEALRQAKEKRLTPKFQSLDQNRDGQIELQEVLKDRKKSFSKFDLNKDGRLTEGEFMAYGRKGGRSYSRERYLHQQQSFYRLDHNHNKIVTKAEFERSGRVAFRVWDINHDQLVTMAEFVARHK